MGIDVNFAEAKENDTFLIDAINSLPNVVMPIGLSANPKAGLFQIEDKPFFFEDLEGINYGVINLPSKSQNGTVRDYAIDFPTEVGTLPSFVTALAEIADPIIVKQLKSKGVDTGITSYHSREYAKIDLKDIEEHAEEFQDKIVLVGALDDALDLHFTPVKSNESGVMLHAAALSTILDGVWFDRLPKKYDYILAITLCFLIMLIVYGYKSNYKGIVLRIFQAFLAYAAVRIGYSLYVDHNVIFDISLTVTLVAFGLFAVDIWNCFEAIWNSFSKKIEKLDSKLNTRQQLC